MSDYMYGLDYGADDATVIVVQVQADGSHTVHVDDRVCVGIAADLLQGIAARLRAAHGPRRSTPLPPRPSGPDPYSGRLDRERKVWRDPQGDTYDLTLRWVDSTDRTWAWHGSTGLGGEPILRADDGEALPFGVLRALHGPISPIVGGAA